MFLKCHIDPPLNVVKIQTINVSCSTGKKSGTDGGTGAKILTAGELKRRREQKKRQEKKRGYCECCKIKYEDLDRVRN